MSEKRPLLPQADTVQPQMAPRRPPRGLFVLIGFVVGMIWFYGPELYSSTSRFHFLQAKKVPLEIHIMSKCPDARDCLEKLVVPAMAEVSDKVDFKLSFIGKTTDNDDGVQCMHGQTECLGNIIELCAADEYPDPKNYLGFTMCLSRDYANIPKKDLVQGCALEQGMDFDKINHCLSRDDGAYGMGLLRDSVSRSHEVGAEKSCTVRLKGKTRCVFDGGEMTDCEGGSKPADLIADIDKLYTAVV